MEIKAIFKAYNFGNICVDGKDYQARGFFQETTKDISVKNSEIYDWFSNYLEIDNINYSYLTQYFMNFSLGRFNSPALETIMNYIKILDEFVDEDLELVVEDYYKEAFIECAKIVCKKKNVKLKIVSSKYKKKSILFNQFFIPTTNLTLFVRYGIGLLRRLFRRTNFKQKKILFLANLRFCNIDVKNNKIFGNIISHLPNNSYKVLRYNKLTSPAHIFKFLKDYFWKKEAYIGDYYTLNHFFSCRNTFLKLKRKWERLPTKELKELCSYKGYNFYSILKPRFNAIFNNLSYIVVDAAEIAKTIKKKEKYSLLVIDHEANMYGKALIMGEKRKTYALSHELIYPGCVHTHIKTNNIRPLPDLKFVWGKYSKQILTDCCNYPEEIIKITGNPKLDILLTKKFNINKIKAKYKLSNKLKILYTPSIPDIDRLKAIRKIAKLNPGWEIILKPHPNSNEEKIKKFFSIKPNNLTLAKRTDDIYELIYVSKYLIHEASTTGLEAMVMGKIVFCLNMTNKPYSGLPYGEAQIVCDSPQDFTNRLKSFNEVSIRKNIKKFIKKVNLISKSSASEKIAEYCRREC